MKRHTSTTACICRSHLIQYYTRGVVRSTTSSSISQSVSQEEEEEETGRQANKTAKNDAREALHYAQQRKAQEPAVAWEEAFLGSKGSCQQTEPREK
jgi:hypothetical protein